MEYQIVADVGNVANVDFLPTLSDCSLLLLHTGYICPVILRSQAL